MRKKKTRSVSKHSGSTTPGRPIDTLNNQSPGILWDTPTLSPIRHRWYCKVQFVLLASSTTHGNQDIYFESKAKPSQESIPFCQLDSKNILPRTHLIWLTKQKDMNLCRLPPLLWETGWRTARAAYPTHNIYRVKMEDPDEKTSVRSVNSSSQREENPTCSTKIRMRCDWRDMACLIVGKKYSANFEANRSTRMGCFICKPIALSAASLDMWTAETLSLQMLAISYHRSKLSEHCRLQLEKPVSFNIKDPLTRMVQSEKNMERASDFFLTSKQQSCNLGSLRWMVQVR